MPSLRKRVSSYFRQLSFHNEPREKRHNINENTFVTKYLQGNIQIREGPPIIYGKIPTDLPNYELKRYESGPSSVIGCYSGPNGGLTAVKRTEKHLSVLDADIDYIDTQDEIVQPPQLPKKSPQRISGQPIDNTTMVIKVAGNEYCVTNKPKKSHNKSHSLGSISDFNIEIEKTKIDKEFYSSNNNCDNVLCKNNKVNNDLLVVEGETKEAKCDRKNDQIDGEESKKLNGVVKAKKEGEIRPKQGSSNSRKLSSDSSKHIKPVLRNLSKVDAVEVKNGKNYGLAKSKSDGNPFHHKKGKIIKITRPNIRAEDATDNSSLPSAVVDDSALPSEWNKKSDYFYGISDSLYDRNQVTKNKNGDPIADCFGVIARQDSAILAVADGVNWGEKASIAAKSAVHGCLHYLNKTIFRDTKPFENLTIKTDESSTSSSSSNIDPAFKDTLISNTREVFVCLLRAFNCAHDLILENKGMLTTLTVAVVLPLKRNSQKQPLEREEVNQFVCCVCNVGDTLAYVYSPKHGVRELTKGSHDINCNRDMRDALGALGPVDGINPELSNLTLSITTLQKGDIVLVASDGLTDNFDPNVCKFTVNSNVSDAAKPKKTSNPTTKTRSEVQKSTTTAKPQPTVLESVKRSEKPPVKPPRRSKARDDGSRSSAEKQSVKSDLSEKSSSPSTENQPVDEKVAPKNTSSSNEPLETHFDGSSNKATPVEYENPLVAQFMRENSVGDSPASKPVKLDSKTNSLDGKTKVNVLENKASSLRRQAASQNTQSSRKTASNHPQTKGDPQNRNHKFLRSKTTLEFSGRPTNVKPVLRNEDGIPYVTPIQRYELQLLLMEDILKNGISGRDNPCTSARRLCENLVSFTISITSAKRHTLEDLDLYFDNRNGLLAEVSGQEKKVRRKRGLEKVQNLPGKLDHVSVVAYNVGNFAN